MTDRCYNIRTMRTIKNFRQSKKEDKIFSLLNASELSDEIKLEFAKWRLDILRIEEEAIKEKERFWKQLYEYIGLSKKVSK